MDTLNIWCDVKCKRREGDRPAGKSRRCETELQGDDKMKNEWLHAFAFARRKHSGQVDRAGRKYIFHPLNVSLHCSGHDARIAELLHDTLEDTDATADELREEGFSEKAVRAVELLTRPEGMDYFDYVRRAGADPVAREVKLSDLRHNMDLRRIKHPTDEDRRRVEKYRKAERILRG